jgi:hypothetical protein
MRVCMASGGRAAGGNRPSPPPPHPPACRGRCPCTRTRGCCTTPPSRGWTARGPMLCRCRWRPRCCRPCGTAMGWRCATPAIPGPPTASGCGEVRRRCSSARSLCDEPNQLPRPAGASLAPWASSSEAAPYWVPSTTPCAPFLDGNYNASPRYPLQRHPRHAHYLDITVGGEGRDPAGDGGGGGKWAMRHGQLKSLSDQRPRRAHCRPPDGARRGKQSAAPRLQLARFTRCHHPPPLPPTPRRPQDS